MNNTFEAISRENFKHAGYLRHPASERQTVWKFKHLPRIPVHAADAVNITLLRRKIVCERRLSIISLFQDSLDVLFRR